MFGRKQDCEKGVIYDKSECFSNCFISYVC